MWHMNLPVGFSGGLVTWRLLALHLVAKALGLLVHVEGFPYGSSRNMGFREPMANSSAVGQPTFNDDRNQICIASLGETAHTYPYVERVSGDRP